MTGKIEIVVRKGVPKSPKLDYYPYWSWKVKDENSSKTVELTPTWSELSEALKETIRHERFADLTVPRRPETTRYKRFLIEMLEEVLKQEKLAIDRDVPKIYKDAVKVSEKLSWRNESSI